MSGETISWESAVEWLRAQPDRSDLVQACYYDDPLAAAAARYAMSGEWLAIRQIVGCGPGTALDLASGRGIAAYALARDGWTVVAVEPDPSTLVGAGAVRALAEETKTDIAVVEEWGERLPFDAASFDLVHCRQGLHHARDLPSMCREVSRVLKPGGVFIATREHVISRREDLRTFLATHPLHHLYGGENAFLLSEYVQSIEGAGLQLNQVLNPFASEINLFPSSFRDVQTMIARRFRCPWPSLIPRAALSWFGERYDAPGRLYTFVAKKPENC